MCLFTQKQMERADWPPFFPFPTTSTVRSASSDGQQKPRLAEGWVDTSRCPCPGQSDLWGPGFLSRHLPLRWVLCFSLFTLPMSSSSWIFGCEHSSQHPAGQDQWRCPNAASTPRCPSLSFQLPQQSVLSKTNNHGIYSFRFPWPRRHLCPP